MQHFKLIMVCVVAGVTAASEPKWEHGLSFFGGFKYPEGFTHTDYVNPNAPKGGKVVRATGTVSYTHLTLPTILLV